MPVGTAQSPAARGGADLPERASTRLGLAEHGQVDMVSSEVLRVLHQQAL
jgi:hypothetical protein